MPKNKVTQHTQFGKAVANKIAHEEKLHASKCCRHRCKYVGAECPVVSGDITQTFPCSQVGCNEEELAALRLKVETQAAELNALKAAIKRAYLQNSFDMKDTLACDKILANALGHEIACWALAPEPKECSCGMGNL